MTTPSIIVSYHCIVHFSGWRTLEKDVSSRFHTVLEMSGANTTLQGWETYSRSSKQFFLDTLIQTFFAFFARCQHWFIQCIFFFSFLLIQTCVFDDRNTSFWGDLTHMSPAPYISIELQECYQVGVVAFMLGRALPKHILSESELKTDKSTHHVARPMVLPHDSHCVAYFFELGWCVHVLINTHETHRQFFCF